MVETLLLVSFISTTIGVFLGILLEQTRQDDDELDNHINFD